MSDKRQHIAVPLRADEAAYLRGRAQNYRGSCCDHLDIFHNEGRNLRTGATWRSCNLCDCIKETPLFTTDGECFACNYDPAWARRRHKRQLETLFLLGVFVGVVGMIVGTVLS